MKIHRSLHALVVLFAAGCASESGPAADSTSSNNPSEVATPLVDSPGAVALLERVQQRYVRHFDVSSLHSDDALEVSALEGKPVLAHATVASTRLSSGQIAPSIGASDLELHLPVQSNGAFRIKDRKSSVALDVSLEGASPSEAESAHGVLVYKDALGEGAHLFHRASNQGTEDFVEFASRPADASLHYTVRLTDEVAGLRLVSNSLEFVDAVGVPRLRVASPYVVDANGVFHSASLSVEGCEADTDASPPFGREPVNPGSRVCHVKVNWDGDIAYPALVDPSWSSTGTMNYTRYGHTATSIVATSHTGYVHSSGSVLIVGGYTTTGSPTGATKISEYYDTASGAFAVGLTFGTARYYHAASEQLGGPSTGYNVVVAGGFTTGGGVTANTEQFNIPALAAPSINVSSLGSMPGGARANLQIVKQPSPGSATNAPYVLLFIGGLNASYTSLTAVDRYSQSGSVWASAGTVTPLSSPRAYHSATALIVSDGSTWGLGQVLVAGGKYLGTSLNTVEIYNSGTNAWSAGPTMPHGIYSHGASKTSGDRVLVTGGYELQTPLTVSDSNLFSYTSGTGWSLTNPTGLSARKYHTSTALASGDVIVVGGVDNSGAYATSVQRFSASSNTWSTPISSAAGTSRYYHTANLLSTGNVLVAGGYDSLGASSAAFLFTPLISSTTCDETFSDCPI